MRTITLVLCSLFLLAACVPATTPVPTAPVRETAAVQETAASPAATATTALPTATETATPTPPPTTTPTLAWGIAFAALDPLDVDIGEPPYSMVLHVVRLDGSDLQQLTGKIVGISGLTASPDGHSLLFSAFREDTSGDGQIVWDDLAHLYIVEVQGGEVFTLTGGTESEEWLSGSWSPDGEYIAYASKQVDTNEYALCTIRRDGADKLCTPEKAGLIWSTAWSPAGEKIAFEQNGTVWIVDSDGSELSKVVDASINYDSDMYEAQPVWSPDSRSIAFAAPGVGDEQESDIFVVNSDSSHLINVTKSPGENFQPVWSPDGQHIAYISGDWELYIGDVDGNNATKLCDGVSHESNSPIWSPDGSQLIFVTGRTWSADTRLFVADWPGGSPRQLNGDLIVAGRPAWVLLPSQ
ncbi:MAG: PD40 domain-containing protein [Anaerolineae bacterium]|nr:PD40 domain-containing protein [Anaerolineae bacterium]